MKKVIIIGGGFAGLSAAVELITAGYHVTIIEQRRSLGGRAYSFFDKNAGLELDNGQHILMGCYENTFRFLKSIGVTNKLYIQKNLCVDFLNTGGSVYRLNCLPLPAPLHILSGILRFKAISLSERIRMLKLSKGIYFRNTSNSSHDLTITEWLTKLGQGENARETLWDIITLATMNENPDKSSAAIFKTVLKKAFFEKREGSSIVLPVVPLSRLYVDAAENFIRQRGGDIEKGCIASEILIENGFVSGIRLRDDRIGNNRIVKGDYYISAVPYQSLNKLLPDETAMNHGVQTAMKIPFKPSPIISIHLLFDKPVTSYPFAALINSPIQWLFNKEIIYGDNAYKGLVSLVISGAHAYVAWDTERLIEMALTELKRFFPETKSARLLYSRVIKERHATFSPQPGIDRYRLSQKTPIKNLFLAGDWTDTGLPATIEGAVLSGQKCAKAIVSI